MSAEEEDAELFAAKLMSMQEAEQATTEAPKAAPKVKVVPPVWKEFVYVEFAFTASDVKEGVLVVVDYNGFAEGAPMQRIAGKYYQTIALGNGKSYKYKVRALPFFLLEQPSYRCFVTACLCCTAAEHDKLTFYPRPPFSQFIVDGKDALDSSLPQDTDKKYNVITISETGDQTQ